MAAAGTLAAAGFGLAGCGGSAAERVVHGAATGPGPHAREARIVSASEWQLRPRYGQVTGYAPSFRLEDRDGVRLTSVVIDFGSCLTLRSDLTAVRDGHDDLLDGATPIPLRGRYVARSSGEFAAERRDCVASGPGSSGTATTARVTVTDSGGDHSAEVDLGEPLVLVQPTS